MFCCLCFCNEPTAVLSARQVELDGTYVRLASSSPRRMITPALALLRFYARGGVRLAWRAAIPIFAVPTVAVGMSPDPSATLNGFARGALAPDSGFSVTLGVAIVSLALAAWAAPRLTYGVSAWLRHLPAGDDAHRRAILAGLAMAQLPVVCLSVRRGRIESWDTLPDDAGARASFLGDVACGFDIER